MASKGKKINKLVVLQLTYAILNPTETQDDYWNFIEALEGYGSIRDKLMIRLIINSAGGDPTRALAIYDAIHRLGLHVETIVQGEAASAAVFVMLAGERRLITEYSSIMIHRPKSFLSSDLGLNADELHLYGNGLEKAEEAFVKLISEKTGQDEDRVWQDLFKGKRFSAQEALEYGLVHEII